MLDKIREVANSKVFTLIITLNIVLAGIIVGLQTSSFLNEKYGSVLLFIDEITILIFVIEILILILNEGTKPWRYFYDGWHIFDFVIVVICILPYILNITDTQFFAVFRLARILRIAKLFERIQNLKILLQSLIRSLPSMSYVLMLLLLLFYIYGVIGTDVFGKYEKDAFGTIWSSMKSMFFVTFEGWSWIYGLEGIKRILNDGFQEWLLVLFFTSFMFIAAMIFLNLFIAIITSDMEQTKSEEKRGKSKVFYKNHTVILGWSPNIYKTIEELIIANESKEHATIVILAERDKNEIDFKLRDKFPHPKTTKILFRSGSPSDLNDLKVVNPWNAKSVIIFRDLEHKKPDIYVLKTIIALCNHLEPKSSNTFHIVAEMVDERLMAIARKISDNRVIFMDTFKFISRLIAQTSIQPRLSLVLSELVGYQGSEFYITPLPENFSGLTYKELLFKYYDSCPCGYIREGNYNINPNPDTITNRGDILIFVAKDDSEIRTSEKPVRIHDDLIIQNNTEMKFSRNILIIGYNSKLPLIIKEILSYISFDSTVTIIIDNINHINHLKVQLDEFVENLQIPQYKSIDYNTFAFDNLIISFIIGDTEDYDLLSNQCNKVDSVILLSKLEYIHDINEANSITLVNLINLRQIAKEKGINFTITTEMIDNKNRELIRNPSISDFIVSSNFISSLIAQLSEQRGLINIFENLFQSKGSEIYIKPIRNYIKINQECNFGTIVQSAIEKNETALGFIIYTDTKADLIINPPKNKYFKFLDKDSVIVLSDR